MEFGVNSHGDIRFGLAAIKGVGEGVVKAIIEERKAGGPFESIYDFVERVPSQGINRRLMENLVYAGAFDSFEGIKREDFFGTNQRGEVFVESLVRYGGLSGPTRPSLPCRSSAMMPSFPLRDVRRWFHRPNGPQPPCLNASANWWACISRPTRSTLITWN